MAENYYPLHMIVKWSERSDSPEVILNVKGESPDELASSLALCDMALKLVGHSLDEEPTSQRTVEPKPANTPKPLRQTWQAVCSDCGSNCELTFRPNTNYAVRCQSCYQEWKHRDEAGA